MWSQNFDCCVACGTTERPHHANGLCRPCYDTVYREKNRDKINAYKQRWRQQPEAKAREKAYHQRPEVKKSERERATRWGRTPKGQEYRRKWYQENRERLLRMGREYHARPEIKERERRQRLLRKYGKNSLEVLERDAYSCRKCASTKRTRIHHIDWDKENNAIENLVVLCDSCHATLHAFVPRRLRREVFEEWLEGED